MNKLPWFTHDHNARSDEFLQTAMDRFGHFGYAAYFMLLELIHEHGSGGILKMPARRVAQQLRSKSAAVRLYLAYCASTGKMEVRWIGDDVEIQNKKFIERQRKMKFNAPPMLRQRSVNAPQEREVEREVEREEHIPKAAIAAKQKQVASAIIPGKPLTPIQAVVRAFKVAKGIPVDDAAWDRDNYPIQCRAAAKLLRAFNGNDKGAVAYLLGKAQEWNEANLNGWQLAGIAKHAWDDRGKNGQIGSGSADVEPVGKPSEPLGADRLLDRRGPGRITHAGELANETIRQIGSNIRPVDDGADEPQEPDSSVLGPED